MKGGVWLLVCFLVILIGPCESSRRRSGSISRRRSESISRRRSESISRRRTCLRKDGNWTGWGGWSTCDCKEANAAEGFRSRSRSCSSPAPSCGGFTCAGSSSETESCTKDCTVDWAEWGPWSTCLCEEANSSEGTWSSSRTCPNPYPSTGEVPCAGDSTRTEGCPKDCTFADCLTLNPAWNMTNMLIDPGLPIENEKEMSLSCPDTYFLTGSNSSTCQNGILTTPDLPACLRIPYWSRWFDSKDEMNGIPIESPPDYMSLCTNFTFDDGANKTYYSCANLQSRICYYELEERTCIGPAEKVETENCFEWYCPMNSGFTHGYGAIALVLIVKFLVQ